MSDDQGSLGTGILLFLLGAAAGAVVVALTTPKSGPALRGDFKRLVRRGQRKAADLADGAGDAWADLKTRTAEGITNSVDSLLG